MNANNSRPEAPLRLIRSIAIACCAILVSSAQSADRTNGVPVTLETSLGSIDIEVFPNLAPLSACDFLGYVDAGLYESATFYRVVRTDNDRGSPTIEVIQAGLKNESKARAPIPHESTEQTGLQHVDGALSLARGAVGTGSAAAFFIVIGHQTSLDFGGTRNADKQGFAVFGRVVRGMDIVKRIQRRDASAPTDDAYLKGQLLREPVAILKVTRHALAPQCMTTSK